MAVRQWPHHAATLPACTALSGRELATYGGPPQGPQQGVPPPTIAAAAAAAAAHDPASQGQLPAGGPGYGQAAQGAAAEFYLSNYRLGKTVGVGSFGKVCGSNKAVASVPSYSLPVNPHAECAHPLCPASHFIFFSVSVSWL